VKKNHIIIDDLSDGTSVRLSTEQLRLLKKDYGGRKSPAFGSRITLLRPRTDGKTYSKTLMGTLSKKINQLLKK
jgi:hypothetical protein